MARFDPDYALQLYMDSFIRRRRFKYSMGYQPHRYAADKPLNLLLAGYVGGRNTGADVRVEEMIRQLQHLLPGQLDLSILTIDPTLTRGYFKGVEQLHLPQIFPRFLNKICMRHHGVVACEGSMFKSKFANALTVMMAGALGLANAENKLSIGYGAEAGDMDDYLESFVTNVCHQSLVICRNEASRHILERLNIRHEGGTDTAWTFQPAPASFARQELRRQGWNGQQPVLIVCPINPFWWPVKPSLRKTVIQALGQNRYTDTHYKSIYFHEYPNSKRERYRTYLTSLVRASRQYAQQHNAFIALVAMEKLDTVACRDFSQHYGADVPIFSSQKYDMYALVSLLRQASLLISSRFHAIVTSMPAQVPSIGITMDERIRNLMTDRGHPDAFLEVDDPELEMRLIEVMDNSDDQKEKIKEDIGRAIPKQLQLMAGMGQSFLQETQRLYPDIPVPNRSASWEQYLPPLSPDLEQLVTRYT